MSQSEKSKMSRRFASVIDCVPEPCMVLGTPLRPFSLGHHLLFKKMGIDPFGEAFETAEFLVAVFICAHRYDDSLSSFLNGEWNAQFSRWQKQAAKRVEEYANARCHFLDYLIKGYAKPPVWTYPAAGGIEFSAPWEELLKCRLVNAGFSESEIFNGYLPAIFYDYYTVLELNQAAQLTDAKNWKRVFFTEADAKKMGAVNG